MGGASQAIPRGGETGMGTETAASAVVLEMQGAVGHLMVRAAPATVSAETRAAFSNDGESHVPTRARTEAKEKRLDRGDSRFHHSDRCRGGVRVLSGDPANGVLTLRFRGKYGRTFERAAF